MTEGPAPSQDQLADLRAKGYPSAQIWKAVLLRSLGPWHQLALPESFASLLSWCADDIERTERALRVADAALAQRGQQFVLVFDALDRLARDWSSVRELTTGLLRFALEARGYKSIRTKIFLRTDQWRDDTLFRFPDASKLRSEHVELVWTQRDLYGLVYRYLWEHRQAGESFRESVYQSCAPSMFPMSSQAFPDFLRIDEGAQARVFAGLAGEFMGSNPRRGRAYNWLHDHLTDASGQTSPRSFQVALRSAAEVVNKESPRVLDHLAIKSGVQAASHVRVEQLTEDYAWIKLALDALKDLEGSTHPSGNVSRSLAAAGDSAPHRGACCR